jgi:hypothetical protein
MKGSGGSKHNEMRFSVGVGVSNLGYIHFPFQYHVVLQFFSRERNKMHARKTRERKKVQTQALQSRIDELRQEVRNIWRPVHTDPFITDQLLIIP